MKRQRGFLQTGRYRSRKKSYSTKKRRRLGAEAFIMGAFIIMILIGGTLFSGNALQGVSVLIGISGLVVGAMISIGVFLVHHIRQRNEKRSYEKYCTLQDFRAMDPFTFESFVGTIFEHFGYKATVTQSVGDHGIDIVLKKEGKSIAVQVKRYAQKNTISEPALREFYGSFADKFDQGFYVTTSFFTSAAKKWGKERGIILIDAEELVDMVNRMRG